MAQLYFLVHAYAAHYKADGGAAAGGDVGRHEGICARNGVLEAARE